MVTRVIIVYGVAIRGNAGAMRKYVRIVKLDGTIRRIMNAGAMVLEDGREEKWDSATRAESLISAGGLRIATWRFCGPSFHSSIHCSGLNKIGAHRVESYLP